MSDAFQVLILEDHVVLADLLARSLQALPGQKRISQAHSVLEGLERCQRCPPDLLIMDLVLPDGSGLAVAEALLQERSDARVIVLSAETERLLCSRHLHQSIAAVIDKTDALDRLHQEVQAMLKDTSADRPASPLDLLTAREMDVLQLIGRGLSTEAIAGRLGISVHTAQTHRRNVTAKLGVKGGELVLLAASLDAPLS